MDLSLFRRTHIDGLVPGKGLVVSDLHLGKHWTRSDRTLDKLHTQVERTRPSLIVFNGDIIEAEHLSGTRDEALASIRQNTGKLRALMTHAIAQNPDCKFAYILGNHDAHFEVLDALETLQQEMPGRISVHSGSLKVHNVLFTHGDLLTINGAQTPSKTAMLKENILNRVRKPGEGIAGLLERPLTGHASIKPMRHAEGSDIKRRKRGDIIFGTVDQVAAWVLYPMKHVMPGLIATLEAYPELSHDIDTVMIGHLHTPPGTKGVAAMPDGRSITCYVTGPSTKLSLTSMYAFDIGDTRVSKIVPFATQIEKCADLPNILTGGMRHDWQSFMEAPYHTSSTKQR